jgi:hypothetical protein
MDSKILFSETQHFTQTWLKAILAVVNGLLVIGFVVQVVLGHAIGNNPMTDTSLILTTFSMLLITSMFFFIRMDTLIKKDGIYVRQVPFHSLYKVYHWEDLTQSYVRQYSPLGEFGGWGMRGVGKNRAFNISGDQGIQLETKNGAKMLIGTNKPDEATEILKQIEQFRKT